MSTHCYILNLPIEILDLVYEYLPNMRDKLNFGKAHGVLGNAFAFHAGDVFKYIKIRDEPIQEYLDILPLYGPTVPWTTISTREEWSDILSLCGSSITGIQITDVSYTCTPVDVVKLASMYCPNLEEFYFPLNSSFPKHIKPLLLRLQNLVRIGLKDYYRSVEDVVETLLQMPKLKQLELSDFNRQYLKEVGKLVNLTKLTITNQGKPIDLFKICSPLKNIDTLELSYAIIRSHRKEQLWPKIKSLRISNGIFHTSLPYLPTLKYLNIGAFIGLSDVFGQSVFSYGKTLEELHFTPKGPKIVDNRSDKDIGIITKLKALKRLRHPLEGDDWMKLISQNLENLEVLIVLRAADCYSNPSNITNRGVMMVVKGCNKLYHLDVSKCYRVDRSVVEEAISALSLRPKEDDKFLHIVGKFDRSE